MSVTEGRDMFRGSGFWSKRTHFQKSAIILIVLLVVAAVVAICCVFLVTQRLPQVCKTDTCYKEAEKLLENLKPQLDPCHDFYEFACGGYEDRHEVPLDKGRLATFDSVSDDVLDRLKLLYAKPAIDHRVKPLKFISQFYQKCNHSSNDVESLRQMLQQMGGWPAAGIPGSPVDNDWQSALLVVISEFGEQILVYISVAPNPYNTTTYAISLDQPSFGVGRTELVSRANDTESQIVVDAYKTFIQNTISIFASDDAEKAATDIVEFEAQLAEISAPPEDRRDHREQTKKRTFGSLGGEIGTWITDLIPRAFSHLGLNVQINDDDLVIISDLEYFKSLDRVLKRTSGRVIRDYMSWRMMQRIGYLGSDKFREYELAFRKVQTGVEKSEGMDRRCLDLLSDTVPDLVGRTYVDNFFTKSDKETANQMVEEVLTRFKEIVKQKEWMDERTRKNSMKKAEKIVVNTGYPDWLMDESQLMQEYDFGDFEDMSTISALLKMFRVLTKKAFHKLRKTVDQSKEWPMGAATVNAAYDPTQNSITIPAAILQEVFFNTSRPMYLNYGAMGSVIGHEITHGFDDEGSQFDASGNLENWWSNDTLQHFHSLSQCFIDQYSGITDDRVNLTLNGKNTLGENIADNGGVREAFEAYINLKLNEPSLPGLTNYTNEQLFFVAYANTWCSVTRNEKLRQNILYDPHSPAKYRVNLPFANYDVFSRVWKCPCDSQMNKGKQRCVVW